MWVFVDLDGFYTQHEVYFEDEGWLKIKCTLQSLYLKILLLLCYHFVNILRDLWLHLVWFNLMKSIIEHIGVRRSLTSISLMQISYSSLLDNIIIKMIPFVIVRFDVAIIMSSVYSTSMHHDRIQLVDQRTILEVLLD